MQVPKRPTFIATSVLVLIIAACQAPPVTHHSPPSSSPSPSQSPSQSPSPGPTVSQSPINSPTPVPRPSVSPTPNIQLMTEADVLSKEESLELDQAWSSPDGQRIVYILKRTRKVRLKQGAGAHQESAEAWLLHRPSGEKTRLELGDPSRLYDARLDWIDNQSFVYSEYQRADNQYHLVRFDTVSQARKVLASFGGPFFGDLGEGWYYFYRDYGQIEAVNLSDGTRRQWPLSGLLANKHINLRALPGGKVLLVDDRTRSEITCASASGQSTCVAASPMPAFHAHLLDPASGDVQPIPALQGGIFNARSLLISADGRYIGANTSYRSLSIVETASRSEALRLDNAMLLGWLSQDQILVKYDDRLEAYDLTQKRALGQSAIQSSDNVISYDPVTRQVLLRKNGGSLEVHGFANPTQSATSIPLPASDQTIWLEPLYETQFEYPLLRQNRQPDKGPLRLLRLKPAGAGLDQLLELPYNASPDFVYDPANTASQGRWYPL